MRSVPRRRGIAAVFCLSVLALFVAATALAPSKSDDSGAPGKQPHSDDTIRLASRSAGPEVEDDKTDWPQWGYHAGRGAVTPHELPDKLELHWVRHLPTPEPAWPVSQPALRFDESYAPVAAGGLVFVPSMVRDRVTAYDLARGAERWRFYAEAPVRFAPVVGRGCVYFGSDDGYVYCLDASGGRLRWRVRGGPTDRRVLGNDRLISTWPVRGAPVLLNGRLYFGAGIWPFMGIFLHALDADTGALVWTQSGQGATYTVQPHNSPAFAGFAPQGQMAASAHGLVAAGGRTQPGCFDLDTGRLCSFRFGPKQGGTWRVGASGPWFFAAGAVRRLTSGETIDRTLARLHDDRAMYGVAGGVLFAVSLPPQSVKPVPGPDAAKTAQTAPSPLKPLWNARLKETPGELFLKAGSRFYFGRRGEVAAVEACLREATAEVVWRASIEGDPWTMLAAGNRLIVVTRQGTLLCFGPVSGGRPATAYRETPSPKEPAPWPTVRSAPASHLAAKRLRAIGVTEGYAVVFAGNDRGWIDAIAGTTRLSQIAVVPRRAADEIRRRADDQGLYGRRLSVHAGDLDTFDLPPYVASLVVVEDLPPGKELQRLRRVFEMLRPYGGVACLPVDAGHLSHWASQAGLEGARVKPLDKACALLVRGGPLPKTGTWTHQYADAANSVVSQDERVRAPLGLLWFGGPSNDEVLPRHGHGPAPQVAGGRLVIEGRDMLRALDVYTGRMLWQTAFPDVGAFYDNTSHQPGANEIGSNYVTLADAVYVVHGKRIVKLDAATGRPVAEFRLPGPLDVPTARPGFLAVDQDFLVVTSSPLPLFAPPPLKLTATNPFGAALRALRASGEYGPTSRRLAVLDRHTGKVLWEREARYGFRHNNIAVSKGRVFCIDALTSGQREVAKRQGARFENYAPRLLALDIDTGRQAWSTGEDIFGTFLSYSAEHDILLQTGSAATDRALDEATKGMAAYRGADGQVLWKDLQRAVAGPPMLLGDKILTQRYAYSLRTGQPQSRPHPLTDQPVPWQFTRNYGCNTAVGCRNLLTFRSAAAGYYDLARDGGTGNWGGFKSGCTSNLIPADGVLSAPDYTRTCTCPYHNQTSLALVHDPSVEMWTFNALVWDGSPVRRVGINFGAPGDRKADDGTLWLDWPSTGGPSPDLPIEIEPKPATPFRQHSSMFRVRPGTPGFAWVASSGLRGVRRLCVRLAKDPHIAPRRYTVRLHFAEVDDLSPGTRVCDVRLQGREAISKLDIVREAGGPRIALVKELRSIEVRDTLTIDLAPDGEASVKETLLCGIEVEREPDGPLTQILRP